MATKVELVHQVLVAHSVKRGVRDMLTHCGCGWVSVATEDGRWEHARHQADEIVAAQRKAARKKKAVA